jgi:hypothetical protein
MSLRKIKEIFTDVIESPYVNLTKLPNHYKDVIPLAKFKEMVKNAFGPFADSYERVKVEIFLEGVEEGHFDSVLLFHYLSV